MQHLQPVSLCPRGAPFYTCSTLLALPGVIVRSMHSDPLAWLSIRTRTHPRQRGAFIWLEFRLQLDATRQTACTGPSRTRSSKPWEGYTSTLHDAIRVI